MENRDVNIVFMGTPEFAVPSLGALVDAGYNIKGVITAPDKEAGRGRRLRFSPVKEYALEKGLNILQPVNLKDPAFIEQLRELKPDLQVVVAFRMLPEMVWSLPRLGTFNLHASLLPQYRGAAPINHAIMRGEKITGLTTFFLDKKIDTGKIIHQVKIEIEEDEDFGHLHDRMMHEGAKLVVRTVEDIIHNRVVPVSQGELHNKFGVLYPAPKLFKEDCRIDWNEEVRNIHNKVRGLSPYPAAFTMLKLKDGKTLMMKLYRTLPEPDDKPGPVGAFLSDGKRFLKVSASNGFVHLLEVQLQGKKRLSVSDFLRGFNLERVERFV